MSTPSRKPDHTTSNYGWALWHLAMAESPSAALAALHAQMATARATLAMADASSPTGFIGSTWEEPRPTPKPYEAIPERIADAEFDRWLAAHDAQVRADERERIAEAIRESIPYGYGVNPDGTEDSRAMAYVEGIRDAEHIARNGMAEHINERMSR